ncbi:hypothetical protein K469DRAFT_19903 [Zopfia rhizophila CBS 207.26]|uniref:MARVEL domain-containing protein n=1 Tax=Zopfia rhizophila CBS 207.26 TaxID=1314779 RepID=A0A6A6EUQ6_9PEZI|nr:hypothetical protein K469DRAFT_19903 [Zopfia rhizophila CBS 207.26]
MGCGGFLLTGLRVLAILGAAGVIGLGAWDKALIHDVEIRGFAILDALQLETQIESDWREFIDVALASVLRVWVTIATACFGFLSALFIVLSTHITRLKAPRYFLIPLEILAMLVMAGAFALTLTLAVQFEPICEQLNPSNSPDLMAFEMLCPISKAHSIAGGAGWFILAVTSLSALISACNARKNSKCCSFEPTASALGMSHGYQAVQPPVPRIDVPTLYDLKKPIPSEEKMEDEKSFAKAGAGMGRRDSGLSDRSAVTEKEISGPLNLERNMEYRPARPWSEYPQKK